MKKLALCVGLTAATTFALPLQNPNEILQIPVAGEFLVFHQENLKSDLKAKLVFKTNHGQLSKLENISGKSLQTLKNLGQWVQPNYEYIGNVMEDSNDPKFPEQLFLQVIKAPQAWEITEGSEEIVVAVTDNGFDLNHDDLKNQYWKNKNEIPNNGIDDDQNGFIDDVDGWNFAANNNNPSYDDNSHGTHVAGIIAAETNNGMGVASIAPNVKVMPIKFYDNNNSWTSEVVARSYAYAMDNGAKIINTSYNIDGFVNDNVYKLSLKMIHEKGGLIFNSAGNNSRQDPPRKVFENLVLVCSTRANINRRTEVDKLSSFSNYGEGIDLCAPGDPILSTVNGSYQGFSRYGELSGTSMASPAAAAVAALIWSKYPEMTNDQVLAKLLQTTDDISAVNQNRRGQLGAGRVNALRALTE